MKEILPVPPQGMPIHGVAQAADFLIVGIGAAAGGLEASSQLLNALGDGGGRACIQVDQFSPNRARLRGTRGPPILRWTPRASW